MNESCQLTEKPEAVYALLEEMLESMRQQHWLQEEMAMHLREIVQQQIETKDCIADCASRMQRSLYCIAEVVEDSPWANVR